MNPFSYVSKTYCINCKKDNVVDLIDAHNRKLQYPLLLKNDDIHIVEQAINSTEFINMKCSCCGQTYMIDWSKGLPEPIYSQTLPHIFMCY